MKKTKQPREWVQGIDIAAELLQVEPNILKLARKHPEISQAKCFKPNGRVDMTTLREIFPLYKDEIIESVKNADAEDWKKVKEKYDALIAKNKYEEMEGKYILRDTVKEQILGVATAQKAMFKSKLITELPSQLTGLTTPEITSKLETLVNEVCDLLYNLEIRTNG